MLFYGLCLWYYFLNGDGLRDWKIDRGGFKLKIGKLSTAIVAGSMSLALVSGPAFASGTTYPSTPPVSTPTGLPTVLTSQSVPTQGAVLKFQSGSSQVQLSVPSGAFSTAEQVTVSTTSTPSTVSTAIPSGQQPITAFAVSFSGPAPTVPITLTINNSTIPLSALVYKVAADGSLVPVVATVINGQVSISFSTDPEFVVVNPNLASNQRQIVWNGKQAEVANAFVAKDPVHGNLTTYIPIWYVFQALKAEAGITSTWNGHTWNLTTPTGTTVTLPSAAQGTGNMQIELNGTLVWSVTGMVKTDPVHGNLTTYMPIWYVFQVLKSVGLKSSWNGATWSVTTS